MTSQQKHLRHSKRGKKFVAGRGLPKTRIKRSEFEEIMKEARRKGYIIDVPEFTPTFPTSGYPYGPDTDKEIEETRKEIEKLKEEERKHEREEMQKQKELEELRRERDALRLRTARYY